MRAHGFPGRARVAAMLAGLVVAAGLTACTSSAPVVTILGTWVGAEEVAFRQVLDGAHIRYNYEGSRAPGALLQARLQKNAPPDIVLLPTLGDLGPYIEAGQVRPLDALPDQYANLRRLSVNFSEPWLQPVATSAGSYVYWVPIKANLKSLVWYDPTHVALPEAPTWAQLSGLTWCIGVGDTPNSGWPASDWIEDILLHRSGGSGESTYRSWIAAQSPGHPVGKPGTLDWKSDAIRGAWQTWGELLAGRRDRGAAALLTDSADAAFGMYGHAEACQLEHQASFALSAPDGIQHPPRDFVPFPEPPRTGGVRAWEVSVDVASLFTRSPQAEKMMDYLAGPRAQAIWPANGDNPAFSVHREVSPAVYGTGVRSRIADVLRGRDTLCLDAADLMPASTREAFYRGLLDYMSVVAAVGPTGAKGRLETILGGLDQLRQPDPTPATPPLELRACGRNP